MTAAPGNSGGLTHLILKSPLAAICVGCAAVAGDGDDFYMADEHVVTFRDFGWEIGTHTINHEDITQMDPLTLMQNMAEPKTYLAENYGILATSFSSPYGEFNEDVLPAMMASAYLTYGIYVTVLVKELILNKSLTNWVKGVDDCPGSY